MTKDNRKSNGSSEDIGTIDFNEPQDRKVIALNILQFMQEVAQALELITLHQTVHCQQIAALKAEVNVLKAGLSAKADLSAKAEPVNFGEINI